MDETATERLRDSDRGWDLRESFGRSRHGTKPRLLCPSHTGAPSAPARRPGRPAGRRPVAPDQPNVPSQPPQSTPPSRARARGCPSQPPSPSHDAGPVTGPWPGPARTRPGAYRSLTATRAVNRTYQAKVQATDWAAQGLLLHLARLN